MKGEKLLSILNLFAEGAFVTSDHIIGVLCAGYGASYTKMMRCIEKQEYRRKKLDADVLQWRLARQRYFNTVSRLQREGLVAPKLCRETSGSLVKAFLITTKGRRKLEQLELRRRDGMFVRQYPKKKGKLVIVAFDIPEIYSKKRFWLRSTLKQLGFSMIQRSVWVHNLILPREFLDDLRRLRLVDYVRIFSVSKVGNLLDVLK